MSRGASMSTYFAAFSGESVCQGGHLLSQRADLANLFFRVYNTLKHNIDSV